MSARPTHLDEIVCRKPTHMGFCDASDLGEGCSWINPVRSDRNLVCLHPWLPGIIADLVSLTNIEGNITNSDFELAALVLRKATLLAAFPTTRTAMQCSGSDNTPTVSWITRKALAINPVVADLLRICVLHSRQFFLNPSVFYHPGQENCMANDAS